eukprot:gene39700-28607_t
MKWALRGRVLLAGGDVRSRPFPDIIPPGPFDPLEWERCVRCAGRVAVLHDDAFVSFGADDATLRGVRKRLHIIRGKRGVVTLVDRRDHAAGGGPARRDECTAIAADGKTVRWSPCGGGLKACGGRWVRTDAGGRAPLGRRVRQLRPGIALVI